jgi:hypothetical protein
VIGDATLQLLTHLSSRPGHDEVKADIRQLLIEEFGVEIGALEFERRVPEVRGRLDALIGRTVFEAKSNLDREWADVERRMPDYLADREREEGDRFVGVATDGLRWAAFELTGGALVKIKETLLNPDQPEPFLAWLDGVIALKSALPPDVLTVRAELGRESVAYRRADAALRQVWEMVRQNPAVDLKRQLWASLLKMVYGEEVDSDALWLQHSFLVIVAKAIAGAVLDITAEDPADLLSGRSFEAAGIVGAVESDFFDWVLAAPEGERLVSRILAHVRRFRLRDVQSDILKVLYESLIDPEDRHALGEYYTPDWLAAKVVREAVDRPMEQKVLDPACGSGSFLFHAVRRALDEAEDGGLPVQRRAVEVAALVTGMDIHPVAVIIARVTYLLALAPVLPQRIGTLSVPVYLGDAMQLSISGFLGGKELTIKVPPPPAGQGASGTPNGRGGETLDFPEAFCRDPTLFDKAIEQMRRGSVNDVSAEQMEAALHRITEQHYRRDVSKEHQDAIKDLGKTYRTFDRLRREGRDTVWAYVARNLSRPLWLSASGGWANVIVGNPPWVAFRHMSSDLQRRFKELAEEEGIYVGGKLATQNDLCALFAVRAVALYLRAAGRVALVLPLAVLSRGQYERFRSGSYRSAKLVFDGVWVMDDDVYPLFPVPACALFARRRNIPGTLPETVRRYSGSLPIRDASEDQADAQLAVMEGVAPPGIAVLKGGSRYRSGFRQGATLVPRMLCLIERPPVGRLGGNILAPQVRSRRDPKEKEPWKTIPGIEGNVESEFLRPVLLGESILPYRLFKFFEGVIPILSPATPLDSELAANLGILSLSEWMKNGEAIWNKHSAAKMSFLDRINYHKSLQNQFPLAPIRVAYAASGSLPAACVIQNDQAVIEHKLYWMAVEGVDEARYLIAILNSEAARARIEGYQSRGQWGARDFDKVVFNLPIPPFDVRSPLHQDLANAAQAAENLAALIEFPEGMGFQRARKRVRDALTEAGLAQKIDGLVDRLLPTGE